MISMPDKVTNISDYRVSGFSKDLSVNGYDLNGKRDYNKDEHAAAKQSGGDDGMDGNDYVTHRELDNTVGSLRREIGLRFDNFNEKFERINDKIDSSKRETIHEIKELMHVQNDQQAKAKAQTIRWIIGTFGMGTLSIVVAIILHFI